MPIRSRIIRERHEKENERVSVLDNKLKAHKGAYKEKKILKNKKPTPEELAEGMELFGYSQYFIRPMEEYKLKSHNVDRLKINLLRHLFCKYPTPKFLFQAWFVRAPIRTIYRTESHKRFISWFIAVAQGKSFYKTCVKDIMTKNEAHIFLTKSKDDLTITQNIWRAKAIAFSGNTRLADFLTHNRITQGEMSIPDEFFTSVIIFFCNNIPEDQRTFDELMDFITHQHHADRNFSLKGRTLSSLIRLSNEWHVRMQKVKSGKNVSWPGIPIENWSFIENLKTKTGIEYKRIWTIDQLCSSRAVQNEGSKMHHCVGSYVHSCATGRSAIFSMTSYDDMEGLTKHATIEVNPHSLRVVQANGPANRRLTNEENRYLQLWKNECLNLIGGTI